jgi:UTP:GlnB (protein PII) uridylyltransferase
MNSRVILTATRRAVAHGLPAARSNRTANNSRTIRSGLCRCSFSSTTGGDQAETTATIEKKYHVEVSNLARKDATQIIVTGPGVLGLLASMCVTLATKGSSIKNLHSIDSLSRDIITVVDSKTGRAFADEDLQDLAQAVLESTRAPQKVVTAVKKDIKTILAQEADSIEEGNITVIPSSKRFKYL